MQKTSNNDFYRSIDRRDTISIASPLNSPYDFDRFDATYTSSFNKWVQPDNTGKIKK